VKLQSPVLRQMRHGWKQYARGYHQWQKTHKRRSGSSVAVPDRARRGRGVSWEGGLGADPERRDHPSPCLRPRSDSPLDTLSTRRDLEYAAQPRTELVRLLADVAEPHRGPPLAAPGQCVIGVRFAWTSTDASGPRRMRLQLNRAVCAPSGARLIARHLHGKEGVDGSGPSEGSANAPHVGAYAFRSTCRFSRVRWVWSRLWSFRVGEGYGRARSRPLSRRVNAGDEVWICDRDGP
jgi:hypothetical protein